jgi:epimerase transport system membrane fusion protein
MTKNLSLHETQGFDKERNTRRIGYGVALCLVGVIFIWGTVAPIQSAALAPGIVQVEGKRKAIQHLEGGMIAQILVANGEWVEADQPLLMLDMTKALAERDILQGRLYNQQAAVDRLQAERDNLSEPVFSRLLLDANLLDVRALNAISSERALFSARSADRLAAEAVLASQRKGLEQLMGSKQTVEESLRQEIIDLQELLAEGYVDKQRLRELERSRTQTLGELADLEVSIEETGLRVSQLRTTFKKEVVDELAVTLEDLYDIKQQFAAADDKVQRGTIRAPVEGDCPQFNS